MSYKRAWELVDQVNRLLGVAAVVAVAGGVRGGGAALTEAGTALVLDYRDMERAAVLAVEQRLASLTQRLP